MLSQVQAPTLVLHRSEDTFVDIRHSRYLAEHIPGARLVELPGSEAIAFGGPDEEAAGRGGRGVPHRRSQPDRSRTRSGHGHVRRHRRLDPAGAELGDRRWRELLGSFGEAYERELRRFRGRTVKALGDGVLATFDGPARAIMCADSVRKMARSEFGLELRAGMHTGEVEVIGDDIGGIAVHIAARILGFAGPGEMLVSGTVKDLVVGSGITFEDRGEHELRGVPGRWRLWCVAE